jgi:hypothetical protein
VTPPRLLYPHSPFGLVARRLGGNTPPNHRSALSRFRDPKPITWPPGTKGGPRSSLSDIRCFPLEGKERRRVRTIPPLSVLFVFIEREEDREEGEERSGRRGREMTQTSKDANSAYSTISPVFFLESIETAAAFHNVQPRLPFVAGPHSCALWTVG